MNMIKTPQKNNIWKLGKRLGLLAILLMILTWLVVPDKSMAIYDKGIDYITETLPDMWQNTDINIYEETVEAVDADLYESNDGRYIIEVDGIAMVLELNSEITGGWEVAGYRLWEDGTIPITVTKQKCYKYNRITFDIGQDISKTIYLSDETELTGNGDHTSK